MIHLFQKKREQSRALQTVAIGIEKRLRKFAAYLSQKTEQVPPRRMATLIMASCFFISVCLGFVVFRTGKVTREMHMPSIRAPLIRTYQMAPVNDLILQRIRHIHHYLDSLKQADVIRYDSFMIKRPHLLDSIKAVEEFLNE